MFFKKTIQSKSLEDLDLLYKDVVSNFSKHVKIEYCKNLIGRITDDIKGVNYKQRVELKLIKQAAEKELEKLQGSHYKIETL